jgi:thiol-disulfide isomerase/thioredoxin
MEPNNQWVDDRLAKLNPDGEWQPHVTAALARLEKRRAQEKFTGKWPRVLSIAAVAVICIVTFPAPRAFAQRVLAPCVAACENLVLDSGDLHSNVHHLFWSVHHWLHFAPPDDLLTDAGGAQFRLSDYNGKVLLVSVWATWCTPCLKEIPWFVEFQQAHAKDGFEVIGISMDEGGWKAVRPVIDSQKINYRIALGTDAWKEFGDKLPESLLLDRRGVIRAKYVGIREKSEYERDIAQALSRN